MRTKPFPGSKSTGPSRVATGRGATLNPSNRFETRRYEADLDALDEAIRDGEDSYPRTELVADSSRTVIATNDSPDVGFSASVNPYRGCEHGCAYCFARPTHEYLGWSAGLDFERKLLVKFDAPELLRAELSSPRWEPKPIAMSGVTDPYQPVERRLRLTRSCLEVLAEFRNPVLIVTKGHLVARDADLLGELARHRAATVHVSLTTLDPELQRKLEPRASPPALRLAAVRALAEAGVPVGFLIGPVIPAINDHEIPAIVEAAVAAGAVTGSWVLLRLPHVVKDLFSAWLEAHFPERKEKVLGRVRETRGGELYDSRFGIRGRGEGPIADQISSLFRVAARKHGIEGKRLELSVDAFRRKGQLGLFG